MAPVPAKGARPSVYRSAKRGAGQSESVGDIADIITEVADLQRLAAAVEAVKRFSGPTAPGTRHRRRHGHPSKSHGGYV